MKKHLLSFSLLLLLTACDSTQNIESLRVGFNSPPTDYHPMPFWHVMGEMSEEETVAQIAEAKEANCGGVTFLPMYGIKPEYLSDEYFEHYAFIIEELEKRDMQLIIYDDIGFPSGTAGGQLLEKFPADTRKDLNKLEFHAKGNTTFSQALPEGKVMSIVAQNCATNEYINITKEAANGLIKWNAPAGEWRVMAFMLVTGDHYKPFLTVDPLDPAAVDNLISLTYQRYADLFGDRFGNTINYTFFDDVGFYRAERTWTAAFNEKFEEINGYSPELYYPVLWESIGENTDAIRSAFYNTRAELLAEGYPKRVAKWTDEHNLKSMGHPPGNYDPMPVSMNEDIFKYYRYMQIPLMDVIIGYAFGRDGHKLISSAADFYDRGVVAAEIYGALGRNGEVFDTNMLFRVAMETFSRGANFFIPHGMWYTSRVGIQPLVSMRNPVIADALPAYGEWVARTSYMLQDGRRDVDIALLYPINDVQSWYRFECPDNTERAGHWISPTTDYLDISDRLTRYIHRDFTFVHPQFLLGEKYEVAEGRINLLNEVNHQSYKVLIMPGQNIMSIKTLKKIKEFYDGGGKILATTLLPYQSSELGFDEEVKEIIAEIFGENPTPSSKGTIIASTNANGGKAIFVKDPATENLDAALAALDSTPDVIVESTPDLKEQSGVFSYMHKVKGGVDIYYFANSTDLEISTPVYLRGKFSALEVWDPLTAQTCEVEVSHQQIEGETYTKLPLEINPIKALIVTGVQK